MQLTAVLGALALTTPLLAQSAPKSCLGFDGILLATDAAKPCELTAYIFVDDSTIPTCGGQGSKSVLGPWTGVCIPGHSITISERATQATYTNATGSYTRRLTLKNPALFQECHMGLEFANSNFISTPNDCLAQ
jgi:hypothetical protein